MRLTLSGREVFDALVTGLVRMGKLSSGTYTCAAQVVAKDEAPFSADEVFKQKVGTKRLFITISDEPADAERLRVMLEAEDKKTEDS